MKKSAHRHVVLAMWWYHPNIQKGVARYAREHHWRLSVRTANTVLELRNWQADGGICLLNADDLSNPMTAGMLAMPSPKVMLAMELMEHKVAHVVPDNDGVGHIAAEYFVSRGYRHLVYAAELRRWHTEERCAAFMREVQAAGLTSDCWYMDELGPQESWHEILRNRLLALPKPVAVYCGFDRMAERIIIACEEAELSVPGEVAVLGTGNQDLVCSFAPVPISSIDLNRETIGYEAAQLLDKILDGRADPATILRVPPGKVVERASSRGRPLKDEALAKAVPFMERNLGKPLSVAEIAAVAQIEPPILQSKFRQQWGRTVIQELNHRRIEKAKMLLLNRRLAASSICAELGFASPYYFYRTFRRLTGMSTKTYRRRYRNE